MKKHDEGYVLAYVTVVLLLFCLIATMILTGSMKNLTAQQDTIQRMEDRYAAEGMIQQIIANGFEAGDELKENVLVCEEDGTNFHLIVRSGTVQIDCIVDSNGDYHRFDVSTVPTGEVSG